MGRFFGMREGTLRSDPPACHELQLRRALWRRNDSKTLSNKRLLAVAHLLAVLCDASPTMRLLGNTKGEA